MFLVYFANVSSYITKIGMYLFMFSTRLLARVRDAMTSVKVRLHGSICVER